MRNIYKILIKSILLIAIPSMVSAVGINGTYPNTKVRNTHDHRTNQVPGSVITPPKRANHSNITELKLPVSIFTSIVKSKFNGLKIHLNNYGPRHGTSWYKGNSSYVKLPSALGNTRYSFSIDPINKFPFRYYINDVNLKSLYVTTNRNRFAIKLSFEDRGTEIKGHCAGKGAKNLLCVNGPDGSAPDIQMNRAVATIYLTPTVRNNSISFSSVSTNFTADIKVGKTCRKLKGYCTSIFDYKKYIKKDVNKAIKKVIDKDSIRNRIANAFRKELSKRRVKRIIGVRIQGNMLIIRFR